MVRLIQIENKNYYQCEECQHIYETEELAQSCENWCKEHKNCNLEIIKYSVKNNLKQNYIKLQSSNFLSNLIGIIIGILIGSVIIFVLSSIKISQNPQNTQTFSSDQALIQEIVQKVLPREGFKTNLVFGDSVKKMIDCGVIDLEKIKKLYQGEIPEYIQKTINGSSDSIVINQDTANYLLNLFWPLGLSNKTEFNKNIPFSEKDLPYLASTGGWWLGKENNGVAYFNKCEIIKLTPEQESLVYEVAQNTFRPCCNNSTFAQDCNHGSALLGALELAVYQGYSKDELYKLALQLNSFWFPDNYVKIALYKKLVENQDWQNIDPKEIMSAKYSSISGYLQNVEKKLAQLNLPGIQTQGAGCGL